jgi:hypothetical protein
MGGDDTPNQIEEMKVEIRALKDALRMTDGYKRDLTIAAEQVLLNTPLVKIGKWFLLLAIVTGMAVWIGGSIYGVLQVKSVQDRTDEIVRQVEAKMATRTGRRILFGKGSQSISYPTLGSSKSNCRRLPKRVGALTYTACHYSRVLTFGYCLALRLSRCC